MKTNRLAALILLLILAFPVIAQESRKYSAEELKRYEEKVKDITNFYFYLLNTLASNKTSPYEKEIIVTESYKKYFQSGTVQVEDDLDERRVVPTNKNIDAYLKDVDFFFKDARFEYELKEITQQVNEEGSPYFKAALNRRLNAITVDNDTINNTLDRFIEVNISADGELRIASVYTTKLSEKEDLLNWWNELSFGWQQIFREAQEITDDSLTNDQLKSITLIKTIDISDNIVITTLEPLFKLTDLERINISNTNIADISALRNLTKLAYLDAKNTSVDNLEALRYAFNMHSLFLDNTQVDSISVVANLKNLQIFSIRNTQVSDLSPLAKSVQLNELYASDIPLGQIGSLGQLKSLKVLDISNTSIDSLPPMQGMENLQVLSINNTKVRSLEPVKSLSKLEEIRFENTEVQDLDYLDSLEALKKIYCDYTGISRSEAAEFMAANPGTLVIFASDHLLEWWNELDPNWKNSLLRNRRIINSTSPTREELASLTRMDSLNLSESNISELGPLDFFHRIHYLNLANNNISSLEMLKEFDQLRKLNISNNPVKDIGIVSQLSQLQELNIDGLEIISLDTLFDLRQLKIVFADNTGLNDHAVKAFHKMNPEAIIIYKTAQLLEWWENLENPWQTAFSKNANISRMPDPMALHKIIFIQSFIMENQSVATLKPLEMLLVPKALRIDRLPVNDISPIQNLNTLLTLSITGMPVHDFNPVAKLSGLEELILSDTPAEKLDFIGGLQNLKTLNISSTQVKNITPAQCLIELKTLNIANTAVKKLNPLYNLEQLEELICYNTKVSPGEVEKFKEARTECRVVYYR